MQFRDSIENSDLYYSFFLGSPHCWDQAIFAVIPFENCVQNDVIEAKFELKEHVKMKSCKVIAQKNPTKFSQKKTELYLPGYFEHNFFVDKNFLQ